MHIFWLRLLGSYAEKSKSFDTVRVVVLSRWGQWGWFLSDTHCPLLSNTPHARTLSTSVRVLIEVDNKKQREKKIKKVLGGWKWCLSVKALGGFVSCSSQVQQQRGGLLAKGGRCPVWKLLAWCLAMRRCFSFSSYKFRIIHVISSLTTKHAFSRQWICWLQKQFLDGTCISHWGMFSSSLGHH